MKTYVTELTFTVVIAFEAESAAEALELARSDEEAIGYALAKASPTSVTIIDIEEN